MAVKWIDDSSGVGVLGADKNIDGVIDCVDIVNETEVFEGGADAKGFAELQQFGVVACSEISVSLSWWWAGNRELSTHGGGLVQPPFDFVKGLFVFRACRLKPAGEVDCGGDSEAVIVERSPNISERSASPQMLVEMIMPQFDRLVSSRRRRANLVQHRRGADGAGVQTVAKAWHVSGPVQ
jgi:hypothetical protein